MTDDENIGFSSFALESKAYTPTDKTEMEILLWQSNSILNWRKRLTPKEFEEFYQGVFKPYPPHCP